jgi:hypothetical protein
MISGQTLRVCPEGKPVSNFPDHALAAAVLNLITGQAVSAKAFSSQAGPVRVKKTRQIKNPELRFDSIETEMVLEGFVTG